MKNITSFPNFLKIFVFSYLLIAFSSCSNNTNLTLEERNYLNNNTELKVAVYPYYAPYQYINEQGQIDGIFIDIMKLIEDKNKIKFKKVYYNNWEEVLVDAKANKIDLILEIQKTPERNEYLNFFEPFFESQIVIVQKKGKSKIGGLENFGNRKMTLPNKYSIVETVKKQYPNINISLEVNDVECLKKVNNGTFDAFIGPRAVVNYFIKKANLTNLAITDTISEKYTPSFATTRKNILLSSIIRKSFDNISSNEKKNIINNWLFNQVVPFYEKSGFWIDIAAAFLGMLFVFLAITFYLKLKIKKRTLELNIAKEKAEESNRFKTTLIQNISHEIRTPMNGIIGFSELLKSNDLSNEDRNNYLDIISKSTKELEHSINNILDISQLETKQMSINEDAFDLNELLNQLIEEFLPLANQKNLKLEIKLNNENPNLTIKTDRTKLHKILTYLLDNAVKFTRDGFVNISYKIDSNKVTIIVEDSGIGIADNDKELIFNSFSQAEKAVYQNLGGLGLGLYFAEKYAAILNAKLTFSSSKNVGSLFNIRLANVITDNEKSEKIIQKLNNSSDKKFNVLIAEDVTINYLLLQKLLSNNSKYKFNITRAADGEETVDLSRKQKFDLILMDIKMPKIDGYEATKIIKKLKPNLLIIAQTAFSRDEDIKNAFEAGCDDFLAKPIDSLKLNNILDKYLAL